MRATLVQLTLNFYYCLTFVDSFVPFPVLHNRLDLFSLVLICVRCLKGAADAARVKCAQDLRVRASWYVW
jgi:hypothetical protein